MQIELSSDVSLPPLASNPAPESVPGVWETWEGLPARRYRGGVRAYLLTRKANGRWAFGELAVEPSLPWEWMVPADRSTRKSNEKLSGPGSKPLGIDLAKREVEVRKLFYAGGFTGSLQRAGLDPEDFLQELFRGILARNAGICPWDERKSSFGHYVHIVIRCVLSNYLRKEKRRASMEFVSEDGEIRSSGLAEGGASTKGVLEDALKAMFPEDEGERSAAREFLSGLAEGNPRKALLARLGRDGAWAEGILAAARDHLVG